jgi:pimeloyl-[acyl-carrier protein] synthase
MSANLDFDLSTFAKLGNGLLPRLDALREADPIHWNEISRCWVVTDHNSVLEGFSGKLPLSSHRHEMLLQFFPDPAEREARVKCLLELFPHFMTNTDPARHVQLRKLMVHAFSRKMAESYRPYVHTVVDEVLGGVRTGPVDFVDKIARRITARSILHVMGLSESFYPSLERWARVMNEGTNSTPDKDLMAAANDVMVEMRDVFLVEIARRRANPGSDFISALLTAREGTDELTENEVVAQLILILIAGHDTTLNTMTLSVAELAESPEARQYMRLNPDRLEQCIMELMRLVAMSTSMQRIAAEDFTWKGRHIKQGQIIFLMIAAANRDPRAFSDPRKLDFSRSQQGNMTFAPGLHFCIGHWFAKMMLSEFFPAFLRRFELWEVLDDVIQFNNVTGFRGPPHLRVELRPFKTT